MAAHTFELSPNWTRPGPPVPVVTRETMESDQGVAVADRPMQKSRRRLAWIVLPIAAATIGLAAYMGVSPGGAAPSHPVSPAVHATTAALVQAEARAVATRVTLTD